MASKLRSQPTEAVGDVEVFMTHDLQFLALSFTFLVGGEGCCEWKRLPNDLCATTYDYDL